MVEPWVAFERRQEARRRTTAEIDEKVQLGMARRYQVCDDRAVANTRKHVNRRMLTHNRLDMLDAPSRDLRAHCSTPLEAVVASFEYGPQPLLPQPAPKKGSALEPSGPPRHTGLGQYGF